MIIFRPRWLLAALCLVDLAGQAGPAMAQPPTMPALEPVRVFAVARFDFDDARVRDGDRAALLAEVLAMKDVSWQFVTAVGHTDSTGDEAYNLALAQRRAAAVRDHLVRQGLDAAMVRLASRGPHAPVADNTSPEGRALNRRTEVRFSGVRAAR